MSVHPGEGEEGKTDNNDQADIDQKQLQFSFQGNMFALGKNQDSDKDPENTDGGSHSGIGDFDHNNAPY